MPKKILVIDDDLEVVELVRRKLEANQYEVITANDGASGFSLLRDQKPDLIVLDVLMPHMDGYSFVQEIKRHDDLRNIPILVVTAKDEMQELFITEGVSCFLVKPIKTDFFMEKVRQLTS